MPTLVDDDDEIELIGQSSRTTGGSAEGDLNACLLCSASLVGKSSEERKAHYALYCGRGDFQVGPSRSRITLSSARRKTNSIKENMFWSRSLSSTPPSNFTPNLIPLAKHALQKQHHTGNTVCAYLCHEGVVHVSTESWDRRWGCGYRNFLMACSALIDQQIQPSYSHALNNSTAPGVRNLQSWIEEAWKKGFDKEGADELNHHLIGTSKWIGTAELFVAFVCRGIPAKLIDFPKVGKDADVVARWVEKYFTSPYFPFDRPPDMKVPKTTVDDALRNASAIVVTDRMPLILQHQGHSRTVVGFEKTKNGKINLLIFDPANHIKSSVRNVAIAHYEILHVANPSLSSPKNERSVAKMFNHVMHPGGGKQPEGIMNDLSDGSTSKRRRYSIQTSNKVKKGKRSRLLEKVGMATKPEGVIEISSDEDFDGEDPDQSQERRDAKAAARELVRSLDAKALLQELRVQPSYVGRKNEYQILCFTLGPLLSKEEMDSKRVVTSEVIG